MEIPIQHIVVKRGGDKTREIFGGLNWALQKLKDNLNFRIKLVLSAPRAERVDDSLSGQTTDLLNAMANNLNRGEIEAALRDLESIDKFFGSLPDVNNSQSLQQVLENWRGRILAIIERAKVKIPTIEVVGCDHWLNFGDDGAVSLTAFGENLALELHEAALRDLEIQFDPDVMARLNLYSGYTPDTATHRGYSDFTAVACAMDALNDGGNGSVELHVHKAYPVFDGDPRNVSAGKEVSLISDIRGENAILEAFGGNGFAKGVLQLLAVQKLLEGVKVTVLVYNPDDPSAVTRVYFGEDDSVSMMMLPRDLIYPNTNTLTA